MPFLVVATGSETFPWAGATPNEQYGQGQEGPALYGPGNKTGLGDEAACTFPTEPEARLLKIFLDGLNTQNAITVKPVPEPEP
jgi:hypothetical protein